MAKTRDALSVQQGQTRKGLQVRRLFTTDDAHPYDELTWERRDAVITNWRDGSTAFEQRDLEFPATWSQNATNIVAQKYFRGPLGTPQREHSVRQMVDRVAGTITNWGVKDGYFAGQTDAEAFRSELTHLLVNQRAAFNSPVWFNVGVEPHPQCSACQPYDALISTPTGMVPIGELVERQAVGTVVYDAHGETRVRAVKFNGSKRVYRVRLRNGSFIEATGDHVVFAAPRRRVEGAWLRIDELRPGMRLHLYPHRASRDDVVGQLAGSMERQRGAGGGVTTLTRIPTGTREMAEAALAGWLQADGFVGQYPTGTNTSLTIEFMTATEEERDWVQRQLQVVFPEVHQHVRTFETADEGLVGRRIRLDGEALRPFVEAWGLMARGHELRVPARLWTASNEAVAAYLRSVFQADGYVTVQGGSSRVAVGVIGERWTEDLQVLLLRLGIYSRRLRKAEARTDRSDLHEVQIDLRSERAAFAERIGFVSAEKAARLAASLDLDGKSCPDLRGEAILAIEDRGVQPVYDIQTDSGEYLSNNVRVHNCFILSVEDTMPSILNWYVEEGLIFKGGSGSGINLSTIRSSKEALGNGGEASGPVSFMRGADSSAGTIKSGGKCFREGTLVATPSGMQPIERLRVGDQVLTHRGPRAVADFMRNGRRQCYRVLTREGYEVEVTAGHKFAYWNSVDGHFDVKPIEEFKPGDALYALLEPCGGGTTIPLLPPEIADPAKAAKAVEMALPTELDERLAYVLGLMYGDGELRTEYPYRVRVSFAKDAAGRVSAQRFRDYSKGLFGEEPLLLGDASGHQQLGFTRKRLVQFLVANGIAKGKADALRFPSMLFRAEPDVRAAFIAGVIDADGSYQRRGGWNISSIDRAFLVDLQRLLMTLGVPAKLKLESNGTWRTLYRLHVVGHTFIQRLVEHIKPHSAKAQVTYEPSPGADKGWGYRPSLLRPLTSRVTQRGGYRLIERGVGMNETSGYGAVATLVRHPEAAVSGYARELSTCVQLTLEAVTPTEVAETYDIEVEDAHLLSANGIYASNTRRAAKMVVLNVNHPDVRDFIWCKAREEHKARVLRDAGFDMDLDGRDSISIQYQNANNSVRVTDDFMHAYESDGEFDLKAVLDGHTVERARARELMREIAQAAWECADPGMQYDTIINDWHTTPESGRINASNPCFTGETLVHTDKGLIRFDELARRAVAGETFGIYTHDATNPDAPTETVTLSRHDAVMVTGTNPIVRLTFSNGSQIRCTPNHRFWTANRGWVAARDLESTDEIRLLDQETPATAADRRLPVPTDVAAYAGKGDHSAPMMLPEKWDPEFAHLLGWLVGDGSFSGNVISAIYGSAEDREAILPRHQGLFSDLNAGREPKISVQGNGTVQLRLSRRALASFFEALGLKRVKAAEKDVPWSILQAPTDVVSAFLRGLFDADGTVVNGATTRYVGMGSVSPTLLRSVQALLSALGISSQIYQNQKGRRAHFTYRGKDGRERAYDSRACSDLRIGGDGIDRFAALVGFGLPSKAARLRELCTIYKHRQKRTARLVKREDGGFALTYNLSESKNHSYIVQGAIVANCSEYMHLDNSACNLASLNLLKFLGADGVFDVEAFRHGVEVMFLAQEIIVGNSSYPTEKITKNAKDYRQLGLGYANLGALLMAQGQPYDSDGGRAWAAAITALMTGHAYRTSARVAQVLGPFAGYAKNRTPMLRVMSKHRKAVDDIDASLVQPSLLEAARTAWDETIKFGTEHGFRNAQASVLAPTGTIGLLMDCDTTGIEPDLALVKTKKLVGGGSMSIVNQTVPRALRQLGYADEHVQAILEYIAEHNSVKGAPALREEHYPIFDCAMGELPIHYMGHIRMMAAVQPFISGAISKCVTGETLIPTTDGLLRIGSLREDEPEDTFRDEILAVASLDGLQKTDAFYYGGVRPVRKVVLRSGHRITGTPNHRLLVVTDEGLEWKELAEIVPGDHVAQQYGAELWSTLSARFDGFNASARYGNQKRIRIPSEMTEDLSFLLGAFAAEGHITRTNHTIVITNSVEAVLQQVAAAWRSQFGVEARIARNPGKCPAVVISSKEIVEFLDYLGCGGRASEKRIPDAVLRSPRSMVLSFLQGLALDAYVTSSGMAKWAICLDAPSLLDDLQAVLTNLGIVHSRISKYNPTYDKSYDEVYAAGEQAQRLVELIPFREPDKAARARRLIGRTFAQSTAEVVPGISGPELYAAIPKGKPGRNGWSLRRGLAFLLDPRTRHVSRRTLERVAAIPGVQLPEWLRAVLRDNLHFSPVARVTDAGEREVFDLSVPAVHAFVGNGIVNHNTVNMPESVSVEEVERAYYEGWKLGLKALAIYRDNCKVGQPLSATKSSKNSAAGDTTDAADSKGDHRIVADTGAVLEVDNAPVRRRLPRTRPSKTTSFRVGDIEGYLTAGSYPDDGLGEIFVKVSKQGSTLSGVMDAFAIAVSMGLQYGVPLEVYVSKFSNMIFEPNGITDDPDIRITQSLVDYIARRLAIDYLDVESRQALGIKTTAERIEEVNGNGPSSNATGTDSQPAQGSTGSTGDAAPADAGASAGNASQPAKGQPTGQVTADQSTADTEAEDEPTVALASPRSELAFTPGMAAVDAPFCSTCGVRMRPAGSCFVCESCGTTSGCS